MKLPEQFENKMKELLKDEFPAYIACYEEPRYYGLRVNTNKISVEKFKEICPFEINRFHGLKMDFIMMGKLLYHQSIHIILLDYIIFRSQAQ